MQKQWRFIPAAPVAVMIMIFVGCGGGSSSDNGSTNPGGGGTVNNGGTITGTIQLPKTGQTVSQAAGDDGALKKGVDWPSPRFTDNNDGTVTDNLTGLVWLKNADCFDKKMWSDAITSANNLATGACELSDNSRSGQWRLPNRNELQSLVDRSRYAPSLPTGHPFTSVKSQDYGGDFYDWYWTSTAYVTDSARAINMFNGSVGDGDKAGLNYVWPVRDGQSGTIQLPKTGQTTSFVAGDNGALQKGVSWPSPRFIDNNDGTVTDNLTGLVWLKNINCFYQQQWTTALNCAKTLASGACGLSDGSSAGLWRLPNINELESLADSERSTSPALPIDHPFIVQPSNTSQWDNRYVWSSSSDASWSFGAWFFSVSSGSVGSVNKTSNFNVWPVRGGQ